MIEVRSRRSENELNFWSRPEEKKEEKKNDKAMRRTQGAFVWDFNVEDDENV